MKLMKPSLDYEKAFVEYAEKEMKKKNRIAEREVIILLYYILCIVLYYERCRRGTGLQVNLIMYMIHDAWYVIHDKRYMIYVIWQGKEAESKEAIMAEMGLNKNQMTTLLEGMGMSMKPAEMRVLIDAFDADGDGMLYNCLFELTFWWLFNFLIF